MIQKVASNVNRYYDLGELTHIEELCAGSCNRSFVIETIKDRHKCKYLIRRYNPNRLEKEIKFEHNLINYLKGNGFTLIAGVIPQKSGDTYLKERFIENSQTKIIFWAVFEYLEGDDRYTWNDTYIIPVTSADMISASKVLARLHAAGKNFIKPPGADRIEPKIMDFLPTFQHSYMEYTQKAGHTQFDRFFLKHRDSILRKVAQIILPEQDHNKMPQLLIHGDYHQGNLKYQGSNVVGVFDFDWSKIDLRLFDLATSLFWFCGAWNSQEAGRLNLDQCKLFLQTYNDTCEFIKSPGPLTDLEKTYLPTMLAAVNLYTINFLIVDFYTSKNLSDKGYINLKFFNFCVNFMDWISSQDDNFRKITKDNWD